MFLYFKMSFYLTVGIVDFLARRVSLTEKHSKADKHTLPTLNPIHSSQCTLYIVFEKSVPDINSMSPRLYTTDRSIFMRKKLKTKVLLGTCMHTIIST